MPDGNRRGTSTGHQEVNLLADLLGSAIERDEDGKRADLEPFKMTLFAEDPFTLKNTGGRRLDIQTPNARVPICATSTRHTSTAQSNTEAETGQLISGRKASGESR